MEWVTLVVSAWLTSVAAGAIAEPHPRVLQARWQEEQLPPHLRSDALHNPRLRQALPYSSALHKGEQPVFDLEADNIPRDEIFSMLAHAGLVPRQGRRVLSASASPSHHHPRHRQPPPPFQPPPSPYYHEDHLQYL